MAKPICTKCSSDNLELLNHYPCTLANGDPGIMEHIVCLDCGTEGSAQAIKVENGWRSSLSPEPTQEMQA